MMNTKVIVKQSSIVRPAKETPKRTLWLSSLDIIPCTPFNHATCLYVYHYDHSTITKDAPNFFDPAILKESLSEVLVPFYPMAGRFKEDREADHNDLRHLEIDCNGEGALFIEAEIKTHSIADFDFRPTPQVKKLLFPSFDYSNGLSSFPLVMVQLTRFSCGGVTLGFAPNHNVGDGYAYINMTNSWSRLTRGLDLGFTPVHERTGYLSPRNPPQIKFEHREYDPPVAEQPLLGDSGFIMSLEEDIPTQSTFIFQKDQIDALKEKVTSCEAVRNQKLSTYEVLAGHIWRTACKARGLANDQEMRLYIPMDGRARLALPQGYCGNVLFVPTCIAKSGDITRNPLWYTALKIHETLVKVKNEDYLRSSIDYLETHPNLTSLVRGGHTTRCPNMSINSWGQLPLYEADFGWGKPKSVSRGGIDREGTSYLSSSPDGDGGFSLCLSLFQSHMHLFETYLYDF